MTPNLQAWGIVLVGHWNRMIFTPEWVGSRLFKQDEVETQIALMPIFPIIYRHELVILEAAAGRLIFRPRFDSTESLTATEGMALTVLSELPSTPLTGVGVNFSFVEPTPSPLVLDVFNLLDGPAIAKAGWETAETRLTRKLVGEYGTMNHTLVYDNEKVVVDINYHSDTPGNEQAANAAARKAIEGRILTLRNVAADFIKAQYQMQLEVDNNV